MNIRQKAGRVAAAAALAAAATAATTLPANAEPSGTTTMFTVTAGSLTVTIPSTADLGSVAVGSSSLSGQLGTVTVEDSRGTLDPSWASSVSSTAFTTGAATPPETIPGSNVEYWSGPATATVGSGTFTPGQPVDSSKVTLDMERTAFSKTGGSGVNSASWSPTIVVSPGVGAVAGIYTGTITHSVA